MKEENLKRQSFFRLLKYTRKYKIRLFIGLISGFMVGGSLLGGLVWLPNLMFGVDAKKEVSNLVKQELSISDEPKVNLETKTSAISADEEKKEEETLQIRVLTKIANYLDVPVKDKAGNVTWQLFAVSVLAFLLLIAFRATCIYLNRFFMRWVGAKVVADLRNEVFKKLMTQSLRFFGKNDTPQLISKCTNDTAMLQAAIASTIADATRCPIEILACIGSIYIVCSQENDYSLIIILFFILPLSILPILLIARKIRKIYQVAFKKIAIVVARMYETFTNIKLVKSLHNSDSEIKRFEEANDIYFKTIVHGLRIHLLMNPLMEVFALGTILIFFVYAYSQNIELKVIMTLIFSAAAGYEPIKRLAKITTYYQRSMAAADRYFDLLDNDPDVVEKENPIVLKSFEDKIQFKNVNFSYVENKQILNDISFEIKKGDIVAFVGATGSGKSTIANLIARFYDTNSGTITIDGHDIKDLQINSLRDLIGIVSQESLMFNESIKYNIAYGQDSATYAEIEEAAKKAKAHEFIVDSKHGGYDSVVGEKGNKLSGGEKQRIAIARAILKNPPILILDEATSALDTITERLVQEALNGVMEDRTVFAIAHRLSTIKHADKIIVLDNGNIVEQGTHDELLAMNGRYKILHDTKFD